MVSHPQAKDSHANDAPVGWLLVDIIAAGARQSFNGLGSLIRIVSPRWAERHAQFRRVLSDYEAAPRDLKLRPGMIFGDLYILPQMPWIEPDK